MHKVGITQRFFKLMIDVVNQCLISKYQCYMYKISYVICNIIVESNRSFLSEFLSTQLLGEKKINKKLLTWCLAHISQFSVITVDSSQNFISVQSRESRRNVISQSSLYVRSIHKAFV